MTFPSEDELDEMRRAAEQVAEERKAAEQKSD